MAEETGFQQWLRLARPGARYAILAEDRASARHALVRRMVRLTFGANGEPVVVRLDNWLGDTVP